MSEERNLFLMRHGEAEPHSFGGDAARRLTENGKRVVHSVGHSFLQLGHQIPEIWHSPYTRAAETASILGDACGVDRLMPHSGVTPISDPSSFLVEVPQVPHNLFIVSHLPFVPGLCGLLLAANQIGSVPPATIIQLRLGGAGKAQLVGTWVPSDWSSSP